MPSYTIYRNGNDVAVTSSTFAHAKLKLRSILLDVGSQVPELYAKVYEEAQDDVSHWLTPQWMWVGSERYEIKLNED